jgi:hypothetical protein
MNSPDVLLRFAQALAPLNVVFVCERFFTAPFRALSPLGLLTAIVLPLLNFCASMRGNPPRSNVGSA